MSPSNDSTPKVAQFDGTNYPLWALKIKMYLVSKKLWKAVDATSGVSEAKEQQAHAAIVTNVEADHLDNWGTEEAYHRAFEEFVDTIDPCGFVVCVLDDPGAADLARTARAQGLDVVTVGESADADLRIHDLALDGATSTKEPCALKYV